MLQETYKTYDYSIFNYTNSLPAVPTDSGLGRSSGGITVTSDFPLYKHKNHGGWTKTIIQGVFIINV